MRAGRVVFFSLSCKHFLFFLFFFSLSYLIFEQGGQLGILTSYLGRFLVQCYKVVVFLPYKNQFAYLVGRNLKNFQKHLAMKMMKGLMQLQKQHTYYFFYKFFDIKVQREIIN